MTRLCDNAGRPSIAHRGPTLDERLAAAAHRNTLTRDCNARHDCTAAHHLACCPKEPKA